MNHQPPITPINHEQLSMSDEQRQQEIADLNALFNEPSAPEPVHSTPEVISLVDNEEPISRSRSAKIRAHTSEAGLFLATTSIATNITSRLKEGRVRREETYATHEDDSRLTRVRKFMGRNALRIAGGTLATLGATVAIGLKYRYGVEAPGSLSPDPTLSDQLTGSLDVAPTADARYLVGGRLDGHGTLIDSVMNNLDGHDATKTVRIQYPAEIAPAPGDTHTLDESSKVAADQLYSAYKQSGGKPMELIGYSEGTQGVQEAAHRIAAENGGKLPPNVKVYLIATPNTPVTGAFNTPYVKLTDPILKELGITTNRPLPAGAHVIAMNTDFWANSANKPVTTQLSQLIGLAGDGHAAPVDGMPGHVTVIDGITTETRYFTEGPQTAALRVLDQQTDIPVTQAMDDFGQAIAPQGNLGEATRIDANQLIGASANLAKEGLNDRGITHMNPVIDQVAASAHQIAPVIQETLDDLQNLPDQLLDGQISSGSAPAANLSIPDTAPIITPPVTPQITTEQINQTISTTNTIVDAVQPYLQPESQQLIDTAQNGINNLLKNLPR